ncbi:GNAT family N-acetyltransferase [Bacillus sp. OTU530]|jgi:GNAT superfamily N-acetyltransferase|uniref:GNAT family N-acetyltransferase n=1 Tax=Bacillus sp. OTU530 TaxID=3043862 RepID=UPI00313D63DE
MYRKQFYLPSEDGFVQAVIRNYTKEDFDELIAIQSESFPPPFPPELWWNKEQLTEHVTRFPQGALCVEINGTLAGSMTGLIVQLDRYDTHHTWAEITDNGYIRNHNQNGNTLYVVDICIRPSFRKLKLGKHLMQAMYDVVLHLNLERLAGGGRMPGYHTVASQLTPEQYLQRVVTGTLYDPVITFLLHCGRTPVGIAQNYLEDEESQNYGVIMEWRNPFLPTKN